jgi:hypothetical protein
MPPSLFVSYFGSAEEVLVSTVRLLKERRFDPPRPVEVEHSGRWLPGVQHAWRLCDDGRGWLADVEYVVDYPWGRGKHLRVVPPERVRVAGAAS